MLIKFNQILLNPEKLLIILFLLICNFQFIKCDLTYIKNSIFKIPWKCTQSQSGGVGGGGSAGDSSFSNSSSSLNLFIPSNSKLVSDNNNLNEFYIICDFGYAFIIREDFQKKNENSNCEIFSKFNYDLQCVKNIAIPWSAFTSQSNLNYNKEGEISDQNVNNSLISDSAIDFLFGDKNNKKEEFLPNLETCSIINSTNNNNFNNNNNNKFWIIDFLINRNIYGINLNYDGKIESVENVEIRIGNSTEINKNPLCYWSPFTDKAHDNIYKCVNKINGRYLSVSSLSENNLVLCHIEIYSADNIPSDLSCYQEDLIKKEDESGTSGEISNFKNVFTFNNVCYFINNDNNNGKTFEDSRSFCKSIIKNEGNLEGDLLTDLKRPEVKLIEKRLISLSEHLKRPLYWIGLKRDNNLNDFKLNKNWRNIANNKLVLKNETNWAKDQPNNYNFQQNCIVLDGRKGWQWNDVGCDLDYFHFICQYSPLRCSSPLKYPGIEYSNEIKSNLLQNEGNSYKSVLKTGFYKSGHELELKCNTKNGFFLKSEHKKIRCLETGQWTTFTENNKPECAYISCPKFPVSSEKLKISYSKDKNEPFYNSTVEFTCSDSEYKLIGPNKLICLSTGEWGSLNIDYLIDQKNLENLYNLNVKSQIQKKNQINYISDEEGRPKCLYTKCEDPHLRNEFINGTYTIEGLDLGSKINYKCNKGHLLIGDSATLICTLGGVWKYYFDENNKNKDSSSISSRNIIYPKCKLIDCGIPVFSMKEFLSKNNLKVTPQDSSSSSSSSGEPNETLLNSSFKFSCISDIYMNYHFANHLENHPLENDENKMELICTQNQKWSLRYNGEQFDEFDFIQSKLRCQLINCEEPKVPLGGIVIGYDYTVNSIIEFHCEGGYVLQGSKSQICHKSGLWINQFNDQPNSNENSHSNSPGCLYTDCGRVQPVRYSTLNYINGTTHYNSLVKYSCAKNYKLNQVNKMRYCMENGKWSGISPKCDEIRCKSPKIPQNALISITHNDRSFIKLQTNNNNNNDVYVTGNNNDMSTSTTYKIGSLVKYRCSRGHFLKTKVNLTTPSNQISCQSSGEWNINDDNLLPECLFVDCGKPKFVPNSNFNLLSNTTYYGSIVLYNCLKGFRPLILPNNPNKITSEFSKLQKNLNDNNNVIRLICNSNGIWNLDSSSTSTTTISNNIQFGLNGENTQNGENNNILENSNYNNFICEEITCPKLSKEEDANFVLVNGNYKPGSKAVYKCPIGKTFIFNVDNKNQNNFYERTCQESGKWDGFEKPECAWLECVEGPPEIANSRQFNLNGTQNRYIYNTKIEYHCKPDFKLFGQHILKCNGTHWINNINSVNINLPRCIHKDEIKSINANEINQKEELNNESIETNNALPIVLGIIFGLIIVVGFILLLIYLNRLNRKKNNGTGAAGRNGPMSIGSMSDSNPPSTNSNPMVVFTSNLNPPPPPLSLHSNSNKNYSNYYDNPNMDSGMSNFYDDSSNTYDPIYENLDGQEITNGILNTNAGTNGTIYNNNSIVNENQYNDLVYNGGGGGLPTIASNNNTQQPPPLQNTNNVTINGVAVISSN